LTLLVGALATPGRTVAESSLQLKPGTILPDLPSPMTSPPPSSPSIPASATADLAFGAFQRGYYVTALRAAMKRIDSNPKDAAAMTLIGVLYRDGLGVGQNVAEAARWFKLGSDRGDREATFALGIDYLEGSGVAKDRSMAQSLFEKAAAQGHAGALFNLGIMALDSGPPDFTKAADYFRRSTNAGDSDAASLAELYRAGKGVEKDLSKAAGLLRKAADQRNVGAEVEYAIALFNGEGVAKDEVGAGKYFLRAAAQNNPVAENRIARMLAAGRGIKQDMIEAMKWHLLARAAGVKDDWLDSKLNALNAQDKLAVENAVRQYLGN
jgi:hypothetical protein